MVCVCENCGSEAEMSIKCEEVVLETPPKPVAAVPPRQQAKRTIVCTHCGNEADMIVDL